jgi:hypothetical protein
MRFGEESSMDPGMLAFGAIFAVAAFLLWRSFARGREKAARLLEAGFAACDDEAPALARMLGEVAGGHPPAPKRSYEIGRCFKRAAGWGMLYHCAVVDRTNIGNRHDDDATGGRFDLFLIDLPDAERVARAPLSVVLAPGSSRMLNGLLGALAKADPHGVPLELPAGPRAGLFVAAFSDAPGKLDERLPEATQERLARAVDAGFFAAHFGAGKLALEGFPDWRGIERQLAYAAEWA